MRYYNKMRGLRIIILLTVINALFILGYYILTLTGKVPNLYLGDFLNRYAFGDILFVVIPSFVAFIGMMKRRKWGWHNFILASGAYLHGMGMILFNMIQADKIQVATFVPLYLIAFVLISNLYLWNYRYVIDFD